MTQSAAQIPSLPFQWKPQHRTLICSLAWDEKHEALMQIMGPTVTYYALQHGMDSFLLPLPGVPLAPHLPLSWSKLILIRHALTMYDTVIWIDSDCIIVDPYRDIRKAAASGFPVHVVAHTFKGRFLPNAGVMILKRTPQVFGLLEAMWSYRRSGRTVESDSAAFSHLIGYDPYRRNGFLGVTPYTKLVTFMDESWNKLHRQRHPANPAIVHFAGEEFSYAVEEMQKQYQIFLNRIWKA